mmetsp:Transcript_22187/g.30516  ORF Transcript_22187/g.30516 Transcript_22187/m.30516 type:complete len:132 (+) Transcript_22187:37-432(+)|eukprot:CAMPEP_0201482548 /NCGR_PEP_ID=MMETSP0151_2-20130828/6831_1 /ASSEMBLY_ACC=CAM_ASM_000257 /TAXON_ID=200890 /ORGANISM="Paramoeba atlantica, Strain 621/1 / CCAP 1560/9" /LENGTH=131 /DNA_ID=CAMNT_0047865301 /DNA_START=31 /DNA_END=426 /DNA_ORIENTATION=+
MGLGTVAKLATLIFFVVTIIVVCATVIPTIYDIEHNTSQLKTETGEFIYWEIQIHEDLLVMQQQLNAFNSLLQDMNTNLLSMDENIDILVNGRKVVRAVEDRMKIVMGLVDELKTKNLRMTNSYAIPTMIQ